MQRNLMSSLSCLTLLLTVSGAACTAADLPSASELQALGLEVRWSSHAVLNVRRDVIAYVTNDENNIYMQSSAGVLTVFDAENGRKLWAAQIGRNDEPAMAVTSNKDLLLIVVGPVVYGFNKFTGATVLEQRLTHQPTAGPVMDESAFYIPVTGGGLYAYSLGVLEHKFRYGTLPDTAPRSFMWRFICNEEIIRPPVLGKIAIAFATEAGNLHSVSTRGSTRGRSEFQMFLNKPASAPLAIADNDTTSSVIMLTDDNQSFSVDLVKGSTEWTYPVGRPMSEAPIVVGNDVFLVTTEGTLMRITRDPLSPNWGRPVEIPQYQAPSYIGVGLEDVDIDPQVQQDLKLLGSKGVLVKEVVQNSPAAMAGLLAGDIITRIDDITVTSTDEVQNGLSEIPMRAERPIDVIRSDKAKKLKIRIPVKEWDVGGLKNLTAIGRFNVYGIDQTNRLVAFNKDQANIIGRLPISGFNFHHDNSVTDQLFLISSAGEVVCLREIGPTLRLPELSAVSRMAKVVSVNVNSGDGIDPVGTVVCNVELPDGSSQEISTDIKGTIRQVYVSAGQTINVGDPLVLISDDKFATYYRNPEQRPIDIELIDPAAAPAGAE